MRCDLEIDGGSISPRERYSFGEVWRTMRRFFWATSNISTERTDILKFVDPIGRDSTNQWIKTKVYLEFYFINSHLMEVAAIANPPQNTPKHDWAQILYMITSTVCLAVEIYQRISVDLYYASCQWDTSSSLRQKKSFLHSQTLINTFTFHLWTDMQQNLVPRPVAFRLYGMWFIVGR